MFLLEKKKYIIVINERKNNKIKKTFGFVKINKDPKKINNIIFVIIFNIGIKTSVENKGARLVTNSK